MKTLQNVIDELHHEWSQLYAATSFPDENKGRRAIVLSHMNVLNRTIRDLKMIQTEKLTVGALRDLILQHHRGEISYSRMVEMINNKEFKK